MHPIMSDLDIAIRQFEHRQQQQVLQRQLLARDIARLNEGPGLLSRLANQIRHVIDPRGAALRDYRLAAAQHVSTGTTPVAPAVTPARVHIFPAVISKDREQSWRNAA